MIIYEPCHHISHLLSYQERRSHTMIPPAHDCTYRYFWHITSHWYRQIRICDKLASTQKNYEVVCTRVCTSRRSACVGTRERVHLSLEPCAPSCDAWPFPSLNTSTQTPFLHTLHHCMSQLFFLSLMSWTIIWNRGNGFCLREIQVTCFPALSKQSRKKGSFHSICEADETLEIYKYTPLEVILICSII